MRRVEQIEAGAVGGAADGDQLADGVVRRVDHDVLHAGRQRRVRRREGDVLVAQRDELAQQVADVRADAEVGDLPRVDADPQCFQSVASASSSAISAALRSQR